MSRPGSALKSVAGYALAGGALFVAAFWGSQIIHRIYWITGHPKEVAEGPPGVLMVALVRLVACVAVTVVLYSVGLRLAEPKRADRRVKELADLIAGKGLPPGDQILDEVSSGYDELPLRELVLIHGSMDRAKYRDRHLALVAAIARKRAGG